MAFFQGVIFLFFGMGLLLLDFQSLKKGWLPCGPNGLKGRLEFSKSDQPILFWLMFVGYGIVALWLIVFALRLFAGYAEPLPLQ